MSSLTAEGNQTTQFSVLTITTQPDLYIYITPGYPASLSLVLKLPISLPLPTLKWYQSVAPEEPIDRSSDLVSGHRFTLNNVPLYESVYTIPLPTPDGGTGIWAEIDYHGLSKPHSILSSASYVKTRKIRMKSVDVSGSGLAWKQYFGVAGSWLTVRCRTESEHTVTKDRFNYTITNKAESFTVNTTNSQEYGIVISDSVRTGKTTTNSINITRLSHSFHLSTVSCAVIYLDGSSLSTWEHESTSIFVLDIILHPRKFAFQRENGVTMNISATYQVSPQREWLKGTYYWETSTDLDFETVATILDQYVISTISSTELQIPVDENTKNRYYRAVITFPKELLQITGSNHITSHSAYLLANDQCSTKLETKLQVFPVTSKQEFHDVDMEVGDLVLLYGTVNGTAGTRDVGEMVLGCPNDAAILKLTADTDSGNVMINKYAGDCSGTLADIDPSDIPFNVRLDLLVVSYSFEFK